MTIAKKNKTDNKDYNRIIQDLIKSKFYFLNPNLNNLFFKNNYFK